MHIKTCMVKDLHSHILPNLFLPVSHLLQPHRIHQMKMLSLTPNRNTLNSCGITKKSKNAKMGFAFSLKVGTKFESNLFERK